MKADRWYLPVLVCVLLNMLDGFDVLVISLVSPAVSAEWHLSGVQLGALFSAGLTGMVLGSVVLAPLADRWGRRRIVISGVAIVVAGMASSGISHEFPELAASRLLTGIGVGGILVCAMVLVSEYAPERWKTTASFLYTAGYSLGATAGGILAAAAVTHWGWRPTFAAGAAASLALLPIAYVWLPESSAFSTAMQAAASAPPRRQHALGSSLLVLFKGGGAIYTLLLWAAFFFAYAGYYFVFSWTPRLLVSQGLSAEEGMRGGVLLSLGGLFGTTAFAFIAQRTPMRTLILICLCSSSLLLATFGQMTSNPQVTFILVAALGALTTSVLASFYTLTPRVYPAMARTAGMGWAVGIGRLGAIVAPFLAGFLVDRGWNLASLFAVFAVVFVIAAVASFPVSSGLRTRADIAGGGPLEMRT